VESSLVEWLLAGVPRAGEVALRLLRGLDAQSDPGVSYAPRLDDALALFPARDLRTGAGP
jgi:hypothetical protein